MVAKSNLKSKLKRRSFRGVAPEARTQLRRQQLIDAGIAAFGERGFHGVTVREICAGAQLTERYFYESFSGLDVLFTSVYSQINRELREATLQSLANTAKQPMELAEAALRVFFEYVRNDPRRARILLIEAVSMGHDSRQLAAEATRGFMLLIREFIDVLIPESRTLAMDVDLLAAALVGANIHVATRWLQDRFATPLEKVLFTIVAMYRTLILHLVGEAQALSGTTPGRRRAADTRKITAQKKTGTRVLSRSSRNKTTVF